MNKDKIRLAAELVVGFICAFLLIRSFFGGDTAFESFALGDETATFQARDSTGILQVLKLDHDQKSSLIAGWEVRGRKPVIFVLGNSQTHSINQIKEGESNFLEILHTKCKNWDVMGMSIPNAGMSEFLIGYEFWKTVLPVKLLVVPVFFDDMRESGIREVFFPEIIQQRFQVPDSLNESVRFINRELRSFWSERSANEVSQVHSEMAALRETYQEKTEIMLDRMLDSSSTSWKNRAQVRGTLFVELYRLRNTIFGIKASTIRRMIPARFESNMSTLRELVSSAVRDGTKVLIYVPPIRTDIPIPYETANYESFKQEILSLENLHPGLVFTANFETIVAGKYWGMKDATDLSGDQEPDYMHFQYAGHRALADSLFAALNRMQIQ